MARQRRPTNKVKHTPQELAEAARSRTLWGRWFLKQRLRRLEKQRQKIARREAHRIAWQQWQLRQRRLASRILGFVLLLTMTCLVGVAFILIIGRPYPWETVSDMSAAVALAEQLDEMEGWWRRLAVEHYTIEVLYHDTLWQTRCGPIEIEVKDDEIIPLTNLSVDLWHPEQTCDLLLGSLTVDGAFGWLGQTLDTFQPGVSRIDIQFDSVFGYPVYAERDIYGRHVAGCCWVATWDNFHPFDR